MKPILIYTDHEAVNGLRDQLIIAAATMTRNFAKVKAANKQLTPAICMLMTLYAPDRENLNDQIILKTKAELRKILNDHSVFCSDQMVDDFFIDIVNRLHFNGYDYTDKTYIPKSTEYEGQYHRTPEDIETVYNVFEYGQLVNYAEKYIEFDPDKARFFLNYGKFEEFKRDKSFYITNERQKAFYDAICKMADAAKQARSIARINNINYFINGNSEICTANVALHLSTIK